MTLCPRKTNPIEMMHSLLIISATICSDTCGVNSICYGYLTSPSPFKCACEPGFASASTIQPNCTISCSQCSLFATCSSGLGINPCRCVSGYSGNGTVCSPINNCASNNGGCGSGSYCAYTGPGLSVCTCVAGTFSPNSNNTNCIALPSLCLQYLIFSKTHTITFL